MRGARVRWRRRSAGSLARNFGAVATGMRVGLRGADLLHGLLGTRTMQGTLDGLRRASGGALPKWSPAMPRPVHFVPRTRIGAADGADADPRSASSTSPAAPHATWGRSAATTAWSPCPPSPSACSRKRATTSCIRIGLAGHCCGQPFESKGLFDAADAMSTKLEAALAAASDGGQLPIVFDTSPCAYRMQRYLAGRLAVFDSIEFVHDRVLPRVALRPREATVAIHPVCSVRKMGTVDKLAALAARCSREVVSCRRRDVLRVRRRKRLQPAGTQRARAAPPEGGIAGALRAGLLVVAHVRDRPLRTGELPVPVDPVPRRGLRA